MSRNPQNDLFEGTTMSFGEHLEELRVVLVRSLLGLIVCCLLGLLVANEVVKKIQGPLKDALEKHYVDKATGETDSPTLAKIIERDKLIPETVMLDAAGLVESLKEAFPEKLGDLEYSRFGYKPNEITHENALAVLKAIDEAKDESAAAAAKAQWSEDERKHASQLAAKNELTDDELGQSLKLFNSLLTSDLSSASVFESDIGSEDFSALAEQEGDEAKTQLNRALLAKHFANQLPPIKLSLLEIPAWKPVAIRVQTLNAHEAFMIWLKAAFFSGLIMSSPWIFFQIWTFVSVGLYAHERNYVYLYLPLSLGLFIAGAAMAFFLVFEHVLNFLFSFNARMDIDPDPRISEWLSFVLFLPIGFGIAFQLPLVMLFLNRLRIFSIEVYLAKWRIAILVIFIASMLLTPADPVSMLLMALPLTVLYFFGVLLCKFMPAIKRPVPEGAEPA